MRMGIRMKFDSCHYLPGYEGKCANWHGHTWYLVVEIEGEPDDSGMIMDFTKLKEVTKGLIDQLDHTSLNLIVHNPTCELLALHCKSYLEAQLNRAVDVALQEGDGGYVKT